MTNNDPAPRTPEGFFADLCANNQPLLAKTNGTLRFEATDQDDPTYVVVSIDKGAVTVSKELREADSVVRGDKSLFDDIVCGRANAMAAVLRGDLLVEGDPELLTRFQRLFPGPEKGR